MSSILKGILQSNVFVAEFGCKIWTSCRNRGNRWRRLGFDGCLLRWGAVVRVLENP